MSLVVTVLKWLFLRFLRRGRGGADPVARVRASLAIDRRVQKTGFETALRTFPAFILFNAQRSGPNVSKDENGPYGQ